MMKRALAAVTTMLAIAACSDGTGPGDGPRSVSLSFTSAGSGLSASAARFSIAAGDTLAIGDDVLVLDRVQIVLREIELKRRNHDACDSIVGDDDGCEEFEVGPMLVDLPLGGDIATVLSIQVDTGTYDELEFELHKPEDDDVAFLAAHPEFERTTVRAEGTFNGVPFVYETEVGAEQELDLVPPLVVTDATASLNVTLRVDVRGWFVVGGGLVNPVEGNKGGQWESEINENVKNSFDAFEDDDRDGDDDSDDD